MPAQSIVQPFGAAPAAVDDPPLPPSAPPAVAPPTAIAPVEIAPQRTAARPDELSSAPVARPFPLSDETFGPRPFPAGGAPPALPAPPAAVVSEPLPHWPLLDEVTVPPVLSPFAFEESTDDREPAPVPRMAQESPRDDVSGVPADGAPAALPAAQGVVPLPVPDPLPMARAAPRYQPRAGLSVKKTTQITPFFDYNPDPEQNPDSCKFLCPRPAGCPESAEELRCPPEEEIPVTGQTGRYFAESHYYWSASNLYHNPLYFEDVPLERYGHTYGDYIQPAVSVTRFGLDLLAMPYKLSLDPPWIEQYTLGWYRPGEWAPKLHYQPPLNGKAAVATAATYTGLIFLLP